MCDLFRHECREAAYRVRDRDAHDEILVYLYEEFTRLAETTLAQNTVDYLEIA